MALKVDELQEVTAVILAGGLGTRLRASVADRPKVLASVNERPFLAYLLDRLCAAGLRYVVICTGYLGEQIRATFGANYRTLRLAYSQEDEPLGTGGALRQALPLFQSDPVLVLNGDSFCDADLAEFWSWHYHRRSQATLLLVEVSNTGRFGSVRIGPDGLVQHFGEKTAEGPGLISAGIYLVAEKLVQAIPERPPISLESDVFPQWVGRGLYGFVSRERFIDIGTPDDYRAAERFFAQGRVS